MSTLGQLSPPSLFPLRDWAIIDPHAVQAWLRGAFECWGVPQHIRVDNGIPWGQEDGLPFSLALWLIGVGVDMIWNHPRRPQENGAIERFNGLLKQWGEPERCSNFSEWQTRVRWIVHMQRDVYPAIEGSSRVYAYPELLIPLRQYIPHPCDLDRVKLWLAKRLLCRKVDRVGHISLFNRHRPVGRPYAGQSVFVRLDASSGDWVVRGEDMNIITRFHADEICPERIDALNVSYVKPSRLNRKMGL